MTREERWYQARWEVAGSAAVCAVALAVQAVADPQGWFGSMLALGPGVLAVTAVYALVVWMLARRERSARTKAR
jgi:hypothetical protein